MSEIKFNWETGIDEVCTKLKDKKLIDNKPIDNKLIDNKLIDNKLREQKCQSAKERCSWARHAMPKNAGVRGPAAPHLNSSKGGVRGALRPC